MSQPAISVKDLFFTYEGTSWVLQDINFNIPPNAVTCIIGPNGGGKTTLIKLLLGLLKPSKGHINILDTSPKKAHRKLGYTPQHGLFDPLFPITAKDIVLMGRLGFRGLFSRYNKKDIALTEAALSEVGLLELANRRFNTLSGGQRQRVLIARALASEPEILFLDEPTANVDPQVEDQLLRTLESLRKRMTIVLVSHDLGFVSPIVENVLFVNRTACLHNIKDLSTDKLSTLYGHPIKLVHHHPH